MSHAFHSEQPATVLSAVTVLAQRAGDHEDALRALVAAADIQVQQAEAELADAPDVADGSVEYLLSLLCTHVRRAQDGAEAARQLCAGAHEQRLAASMLLTYLACDSSPEPCVEPRARRDAVLVVDDHGDIRDGVAEVLREAGFVVRTAANGLEGLLTAYEMRPAVIVMDVTMPVLDGIEATRLIKATEATRRAQVIAYTGNSEPDERLVHTLFSAVVKKPAPPAALLATVLRVASLCGKPA